MSLPDNRVSTTPVVADFLNVDGLRESIDLLTDYELGGTAIRDASDGIVVQTWTATYNDVTGEVFVTPELTGIPELQFVQADIVVLGLAFDQSMNPAITYQLATGETYLWWFDPTPGVQEQVFLEIPEATYPCITLDDKRTQTLAASDIILAYQKASGGLFARQQRDRYGVEYTLTSDLVPGVFLYRIGMSTNNRLRFDFDPVEV